MRPVPEWREPLEDDGGHPRVEAGEAESFDRFFERAWPGAFRLAGLLTHDQAAGEDIAQQAMIDIFRRWDEIDQPQPYLRRAVVNRAYNWNRNSRTRQQKLRRMVVEVEVMQHPDEMSDAIAALPYRQRAVIVLRYYLDLSEVEIADALNCRPGTVKSLASRALTRLRSEQEL